MPARHVVVDGSNIATEGNSLPSLRQLDEAVREYLRENPDDTVTVVVDATFGHRIPAEEREMFELAEREGDIVSPPAGAIGRGDAFLLRIADKVGAVVLSNDSFQEFHGEHEWLFDKGRLIGGKPVPGVGWIFTPRTPVRGPKSRESVKEAKRKRRAEQGDDSATSGLELAAGRSQGRSGARRLQKAIEVATEEAVLPEKAARKRRRRRKSGEAPSEPVNDPLAFISFIASYRPGDEVEGLVEEFSSHGAYVSAGGARCYLPLSAMGNPPPRSARESLRKGEARTFVVQAFDPMRRGIELAIPGFAHPAGSPTPETVEAEIHLLEELASAEPRAEAAEPPEAPAGTKRVTRRRAGAGEAGLAGAGEAGVAGAGEAGVAGAGEGELRTRASRTRKTGPAEAAKAADREVAKVSGSKPRAVKGPGKSRPSLVPSSSAGAGRTPTRAETAAAAGTRATKVKAEETANATTKVKASEKENSNRSAGEGVPAGKAAATRAAAKRAAGEAAPDQGVPAGKAAATRAAAKRAAGEAAPEQTVSARKANERTKVRRVKEVSPPKAAAIRGAPRKDGDDLGARKYDSAPNTPDSSLEQGSHQPGTAAAEEPAAKKQPAGPDNRPARLSSRSPRSGAQAAGNRQQVPAPAEQHDAAAHKRPATKRGVKGKEWPETQASDIEDSVPNRSRSRAVKPKLTVLPGALGQPQIRRTDEVGRTATYLDAEDANNGATGEQLDS